MKKNRSNVILALVFLVGLSLLSYPALSNFVNQRNQTSAITTYQEGLSTLEEKDYTALWQAAESYNQRLAEKGRVSLLDEETTQQYNALLNPLGNGIMGYVSIPTISVNLPIYHGTTESVLQVATGHLPVTSLPTGGAGTHAAISGHRGLPSAKLFTNLDQLREGDLFMLNILDRVLVYEVDQILIVLPEEVDGISIEEGEDLCTLVTCTPYGINSHRLLVRGHRIDYKEAVTYIVQADGVRVQSIFVAAGLMVPMLLVLVVIMLFSTRKTKRKQS